MGFIGCLALLVYLPLLAIVRGWAICVIWNWYMPVVFVGSVHLSIPAAMGLSVLIGMFSSAPATPKTTGADATATKIVSALLTPFVSILFAVGFAWLVRHWL